MIYHKSKREWGGFVVLSARRLFRFTEFIFTKIYLVLIYPYFFQICKIHIRGYL